MRDFIGVSWTTLYCENKTEGLQEFLDSLPRGRYFTVCQHDDGVRERLPYDTLVFSASQRVPMAGYEPIPLVASPIPGQRKIVYKDIFASFVGSLTHPLRAEMMSALYGKPDYELHMHKWSPSVTTGWLEKHIDILSRSRLAFCPRGYGNTSFRMYEAMQLGAVPVYISDDFCLPWSDEVDWSRLAILVKEEEVENLNDIMSDISHDQILDIKHYTSLVYDDYFSMLGVCENIIKRVK